MQYKIKGTTKKCTSAKGQQAIGKTLDRGRKKSKCEVRTTKTGQKRQGGERNAGVARYFSRSKWSKPCVCEANGENTRQIWGGIAGRCA